MSKTRQLRIDHQSSFSVRCLFVLEFIYLPRCLLLRSIPLTLTLHTVKCTPPVPFGIFTQTPSQTSSHFTPIIVGRQLLTTHLIKLNLYVVRILSRTVIYSYKRVIIIYIIIIISVKIYKKDPHPISLFLPRRGSHQRTQH